MRALGGVLLLAGLSLFVITVDRSMWVLFAIGLTFLAAALLVRDRSPQGMTWRDAAAIVEREQARAGAARWDRPLTQPEVDRIVQDWNRVRAAR